MFFSNPDLNSGWTNRTLKYQATQMSQNRPYMGGAHPGVPSLWGTRSPVSPRGWCPLGGPHTGGFCFYFYFIPFQFLFLILFCFSVISFFFYLYYPCLYFYFFTSVYILFCSAVSDGREVLVFCPRRVG
uniref:Uncharacterized protein n=1 Tax=Cacopsylla melanoneura TaxID=428564 RepID=A0A8D8ZUK5_9HEMI